MKYNDWVDAFLSLRDGGAPVCPNCDRQALAYRAFSFSSVTPSIGWAVVFCRACNTGARMSRIQLTQQETDAENAGTDAELCTIRLLY